MKRKNYSKTTKGWFGEWSNEYDNTLGNISHHQGLLDLVVTLSDVKDNSKILDIGCGTGLLSLKFLQSADCFIVGIDVSKEMLSIFKNKIDKLNLKKKITCKSMDAASLKFNNNTFDIVASTVTLHHLKEKQRPLRKIYNILKPGGKLIIGDIDMDTTGSLVDITRFKRICKVLEDEWFSALRDVGVKAFERMFDNGKKHILNDGEYCISFKQWKSLCQKANFKKVSIKSLHSFKWFKVLVAFK